MNKYRFVFVKTKKFMVLNKLLSYTMFGGQNVILIV